MLLLPQYVPDRPSFVAFVEETTLAAMAEDRARPAAFSKSVFERYAQDVVHGLGRLLIEARNGNIDLAAMIYELRGEERQVCEYDRRLELVALKAPQHIQQEIMKSQDAAEARELVGQVSWLRDVNKRVLTAYQDCRIELERFRDSRLKTYAGEWQEYLSKLDLPVAEDVRSLWSYLRQHLWAPEAAPTDDGFRMVWDRGPHHLQVEVMPGHLYDWFYRNRDTGEVRFGEDLPLNDDSGAFNTLLSRLAKS